jgi:hypothetical protein
MDLYTSALILGAAGLGLMAVGGFTMRGTGRGSHGHSGHGNAGHGHAGHGTHGGHAGHGSHGAGTHHAATHGAQHAMPASSRIADALSSFLSVRSWFSIFVGFGAAGILFRSTLGGPLLFGAALVVGLAFEFLLIAPFWNFLFRFASSPALTLESVLDDTVRAVTSFDAEGHGLVSVDVDGQVRQILATLTPQDRAAGARVRAGDEVRIEAIDSARNRCTVTVSRG